MSRKQSLVSFSAILLLFGVFSGRYLVIDRPSPSEVIVVLAGDSDVRLHRAVDLLDQDYAKRLIVDVPAPWPCLWLRRGRARAALDSNVVASEKCDDLPNLWTLDQN